MEEFEQYQEFGLSKNESKVYDALVRVGKLGAGDISRESGVSYSKIYVVLNSLISKGLVQVIPEKTKKFIPSNPESLVKLIEKKQHKLEKAKQKAIEMKKTYESKEKNPVKMVLGKGNFYKIIKEIIPSKKYNYTIKYTSEYRPDWARDAEKRIKQGKDIRVLTRYDKETEKNVKKWMKIYKQYREIENQGVAMSIVDDQQVMLALIKSNVTLMINDPSFAKLMKKLFLNTYKVSQKIS